MKLIEDEKIIKFITDVCNILKVNVPQIEYANNDMNKSSSASMTFKDGVYYLKITESSINPNDTYFVVARELRHMWQMMTDKAKYFKGYLVVPSISEEDQNAQISEIDSTAFAIYVLRRFFSITPKVLNSPETNNLIDMRYNYIVSNYSNA